MSGDHISPWMPEQDQHRLAVLGKLIEELGEASKAAGRCIIHGLDEIDPDTGRTNREELDRELSDVIACIETAEIRIGTKIDTSRVGRKFDGFRKWHALIDQEPVRQAAKLVRPDPVTVISIETQDRT